MTDIHLHDIMIFRISYIDHLVKCRVITHNILHFFIDTIVVSNLYIFTFRHIMILHPKCIITGIHLIKYNRDTSLPRCLFIAVFSFFRLCHSIRQIR